MNAPYDLVVNYLRDVYGRRLCTPAVLDPASFFPAAKNFESAWEAIRDEALGIQADLSAVPRFHELMAQQASISANDGRDWRLFVLKAYGVLVPANAARCPTLSAVVAQSEDVLSAALSFLAPYKRVPEHRGPMRAVIRYYLALCVPLDEDGRPGTTLTIDGRDHLLGDGQSLLWDDTFAHQVRNRTGKVRAALLLDVRRRQMPPDLAVLSKLLIAAASVFVRLRMPG